MDVSSHGASWRRMVRNASATLSRVWRFAPGSAAERPFVESALCAVSIASRDATGHTGSDDNVEDIYPLSSLQHAMLMQSLEGTRFGINLEQILVELRENLDLTAFRNAWQRAVERHPILRTVFQWEGEGGPRQIVLRRVTIPWAEADWRGLPARDRRRRFEAFLRSDRERGFDLAGTPATRFTVVREEKRLYRLCWTLHHVIIDGRQLVLLFNEVFSEYEALRRGEKSAIATAPSYRSYIDWLQQNDWSDAEVYWRRRLKGFDTPTRLIFSNVQPQTLARAPIRAEQRATLSGQLTMKLKTWARANDLTLNTLVQGAWAVLLARYSDQQDVVFGAIRACRRSVPGADQIVGPCINTVPIRIRVDPDQRLLPWLKDVRDQWVTLREYEHTPLTVARDCSDVPRSEALFQTIMNFQDPSWDAALSSQGGKWGRRAFDLVSQPGLPLALDGYGGEQIKLKLLYDRRHFDHPAIQRMLGHLQTLLEGMAADPDQRLATLPLLTEEERHKVLVTFNDRKTNYPRHACVHRLFEIQVRSSPDAIALMFSGQTLTYRELSQKANQAARFLRRRGVRRGALVGICVERSLEMVIGMLGILKAGGAYVPLDPAYPHERLTFMLADTQILVLLTQQRLRGHLPNTEAAVFCLDSDWPAIAEENSDDLEDEIGAEDLAYVMYTSGSTGRPKGVCVPHRGVVRLVKDTNYVSLNANEVLLQFAPISFDASTFEIWGALLNGGRLVIFPPHRSSLEQLGRAIEDYGITTLWLTAALFQHMVDQCLDSLRGVRQLLAGGDVLPLAAARRVLEELPACCLINGYGPTENTTFTCCHPVTELSQSCTSVPIGRPIANTTTYVLDNNLQPVPIGVPGELWTGGDGLARGYLNHPELTAERFLPDPFSGEPGARMYRTGDRVRWLQDGNLEFLGRFDQQVKIRGFRVEPGEVEAILAGHPAVGEAVVVAREDTAGDRRLVGYVVLRTESDLTAEGVRSFLKEKLPEYMVPSAVVLLPALPLTANGKVDRQALPLAGHDVWDGRTPYLAPRTVTEEIVAGIWADVLKLEAVGAEDHFFERGGDSLRAMSTVVRLGQALQVDIPVSLLFDHPTLANLSERIDELRVNARARKRAPVLAVPRDRPLPLSFYQERIWGYCQATDDPLRFFTQVVTELRGRLDIAALERSIGELFRRHEVLRSTFETRDGEPVQVIGFPPTMSLPVIDLAGQPDVEDVIQRYTLQDAHCPFDLTRGPFLRATLLRRDDQSHRLLLSVHHLIYDASVRDVLYRELGVLYEAFRNGEPSPLPEPALQYGDFAAWQRRWLGGDGELFQRQFAYWKKQLGGNPPLLQLPLEPSDPGKRELAEAIYRFPPIPDSVFRRLGTLSRREGATPFMILLAGFKALLHRSTGQEDILVGTYLVNRTQLELEGVVGLKTNQVVLRTQLSGNPTFRELLRRVRQTTLDAYDNQDIPFSQLMETLQASGYSPPSIEANVQFVQFPEKQLLLSELDVEFLIPPTKAKPWGLSLSLVQSGDQWIRGGVSFDIDRYDPAGVRRMIATYVTLLEQVTADPELRLSDLQAR